MWQLLLLIPVCLYVSTSLSSHFVTTLILLALDTNQKVTLIVKRYVFNLFTTDLFKLTKILTIAYFLMIINILFVDECIYSFQ